MAFIDVAGSKSDAVSKRIECGVIMKSEECCKISKREKIKRKLFGE